MTVILISNNPENLRVALGQYDRFAVVEAEYGSVEVKGSNDRLTLNHHIDATRPPPCVMRNLAPIDRPQAIGISHFDLDTLGGVLSLIGEKYDDQLFWETAGWVDVAGVHKLPSMPRYNRAVHIKLAAFWAWSQKNRLMAPRDGSVQDVTTFFERAADQIALILNENEYVLEEGLAFLDAEKKLVEESFKGFFTTENGLRVVFRVSGSFVNHLYYNDTGTLHPADIVVGFNTTFKSVTLSKASSEVPINCRELVRELWGPEAGGHEGIAGSPRGQEMTQANASDLIQLLVEKH